MKKNPKNRLFTRSSILGASLPAIFTVVLAASAHATPLYWDVNGATASFNASANGAWNGTNNFWNTDAGGGAGTLSAVTTSADDLSLSSVITIGTITLTDTASASSLTLNANGVNITGGTLAIGGTGVSSGIFMSSSTTNNTVASAVTLNNGPITFENTGTGRTLFVTGTITGSQNLTLNHTGTGAITLTNVNNTGTVTVTNATNSTGLNNITTLGSNVSALTMSSGSNATTTTVSNIVVNASGTTLSNNMSAGTGRALSVGATTGTGDLFINNNATVGANMVQFVGILNHTGNVTFGGTGTATFGAMNRVIGSNVVDVTKTGTQTLSLSNVNAYTGNTTVNGGILNVDFNSGTATGSGNQSNKILATSILQLGGGTLQVTGTTKQVAFSGATLTGAVTSAGTNLWTVTSTGLGLKIVAGMAITGSGITGGYVVSETTNGAVIFSTTTPTALATNLAGVEFNPLTSQTFASTTLNAGASLVNAFGTFGAGLAINLGTITRNAGSTLAIANVSTTNAVNSATNGVTTTNSNVNGIIGGWAIVNNSGFASNSGTHIVNLAGTDNTWTSGTNNNITTTGAIGIADGANVNSVKTNTAGARTITLAGTSIIQSGGLLVGIGVGANLTTITGGTLMGASGADLIVHQLNTFSGLTIDSTIADNGLATGLTKSQAGTLTLGGANTFTGNTIVNAGVVTLTNNAALQNSAVDTAGVGTITLSGTNTPTLGGLIGSKNLASVITSGAGSVTSLTLNPTNGAVTNTYSGIIANLGSGAMGLNLSGLGTQVLSGVNTYTGATTLTGGTLSVGSIGDGSVAGNLGNASSAATNLVFDGGTLQYTGATATSDRAFTINAGKTATINSANNISFAGATGTATNGALTKTGAGTLTLTGTNTYTGATLINTGILQLGNGSTTGALTGTSGITNNGTLIVNRSNSFTQLTDLNNQAITGSGSFTQAGAGTTTLSGTNSYTGDTLVTKGILSLGNGTTNTSLADTAGVVISADSTAVLNLNYTGTDTIASLTINGVAKAPGVYDSSDPSGRITGTGTLTVGAVGDVTPPTLASSDIVDDKSGAPVLVGTLVTYTVTFNEDMDDATVSDADFGNAGTAAVTIGSVTETSPSSGVFTVQATPSSTGTLVLQVNADAVLKDAAGNDLNTTSAIADDTSLNVITPFESWSGGAAFTTDTNSDGVNNGLAWLLGAADPNVSALSLLPTPTVSGGNLTLSTFNRVNPKGSAKLFVEYSNDLSTWTSTETATDNGVYPTGNITITIAGTSPQTISVTVSAAASAAGKLFARLRASEN